MVTSLRDALAVRHLLAVCLQDTDSLQALGPALRLLRHTLPDTRLALLAPGSAGLALALPEVDETLDYPRGQDAGKVLALISEVRQRSFDAALVFTTAGCSPYLGAYVCYLAGVPLRLGQSSEFGGAVLSHRFPADPGSGPARAQYLALAGRALRELAPAGPVGTG